MNQRIKVIILIAIIISVTILAGVYYLQRNNTIFLTPHAVNFFQDTVQTKLTVLEDTETQKPPEEKVKLFITGKVRSMNDKQIYIELADGKGSAINIEPTVPVRIEGGNKIGNLSILKLTSMVSVKVDKKNNAVEIIIGK